MNEHVTGLDFLGVLPATVAILFAMAVLLLEVFQRPSFGRTYLSYISAAGLSLTGLVAWLTVPETPASLFGGMAVTDALTGAVTMLCAAAGAITALGSSRYLQAHGVDRGEYYALLLFATAGMSIMVGATDFITLFMGLEIQAVALYALTAYSRHTPESSEAGLKYFLLGALASGLLVFGVALLFGISGSTNFGAIRQALEAPSHFENVGGLVPFVALPTVATILILAAFLIKIAAAPFHMWAPDAYTGAPTPAVGFMSGAAKIAGVATILRLLTGPLGGPSLTAEPHGWTTTVFYLALASILVGNLVGLAQRHVKRMLAWSSVAQAGYVMLAAVTIGVTQGDSGAVAGFVAYGFAYAIAAAGAFAVLGMWERDGHDVLSFDELNGLGRRDPWLGAAMTLFMLSAAGLPPTAGFVGKLTLFGDLIGASTRSEISAESARLATVLTVGALLLSVAGAYYYLRVIMHLFFKQETVPVTLRPHRATTVAVVAAALLTLWMGLLPGRVMTWGAVAAAQLAPTSAASGGALQDDGVRRPLLPREPSEEAGAKP